MTKTIKLTYKTVTLNKRPYEIATPYETGQKTELTAGEAHALNQTRVENIGNLCRVKIADMPDQPARDYVHDVDGSYKFGVTAGRVTDPVVRQMAIVAAGWAKAELKAASLVHDLPAIKVKATEIMIDREDKVRARAVKIVALLAEDAELIE